MSCIWKTKIPYFSPIKRYLLSKTFDSIDHQRLLEKLRKLNVSDLTLACFQSYLTDRTQRVRFKFLSDSLTIKHGVPQGSILGPLLFNIYINGLPSVCQNCNIKSHVDDSKLYVSFFNKNVNGGLVSSDKICLELLLGAVKIVFWSILVKLSSVCLAQTGC